MGEAIICVEVAYALPDKQKIVELKVPQGTHAREAVLRSGLDQEFVGLDLQSSPLGVFGKAIPKPEAHILEEGERVEIYRPLLADPKEVRRQRAAKAKAKAKAEQQQTEGV
ncbi:RnfH family protein [Denitrificimonas sp. JX-1]|uniref:UPF0125 protein TOI97_03510 n=1 Tax=Denitrificimonas halotolerans TaxID=3098930 RepID=A0ABU5GPG7_9GAMM|nr:RnfH family protein [Denitrificimonas sp. JX-1]MDY7218644.1 RnfH family protein [Denitrificimonas sp. JX-1]